MRSCLPVTCAPPDYFAQPVLIARDLDCHSYPGALPAAATSLMPFIQLIVP